MSEWPEWQPIETARKTERILVLPKWGPVQIARWIGAPHNIWRVDSGNPETPTHWMPLPPLLAERP